MTSYNVAVVGATGAVGEQMNRILDEREFPIKSLKLLASERSLGRSLNFKGESVGVEELDNNSFENIDIALFSAGAGISRQFSSAAVASGAVVIDNSSAFRMEPDVPLVVPEVNPEDIDSHKGIIANPNCSTIQMVLALKPLHDNFIIKRVVVSTYQAVSGTGKEAVQELVQQTRAALSKQEQETRVYPHPIAFNILPHIDVFDDEGNTKEEQKMINETRKIMHVPNLAITATAARVPVLNGHSESVNIEFEKMVTAEKAREVLVDAPGIEIQDNPEDNLYPLPTMAAGKDMTFVGRIRQDSSVPSGLNLWIVSDNLRKGAALNAVQIAEILITK